MIIFGIGFNVVDNIYLFVIFNDGFYLYNEVRIKKIEIRNLMNCMFMLKKKFLYFNVGN